MKNLIAIFFICSSCVALYIGAGFATMQEIFQYQGSYGSEFWIVILVEAIIFTYTCVSFVVNSKRVTLMRGGDIYKVYCGRYIGKFFDYFAAFFCYMSFIVMCGGASSTVAQQWGIPSALGAIILAAIVVLTVVFGLDGIVDSLGVIAPIIVVFIVVIASLSIANCSTGISEGFAVTDSGKYPLIQVGNGNPVASGISEGGYVLLWFAVFLAELGSKNPKKTAVSGVLLSVFVIFGVCILVCVALNANIEAIWNSDVPALVLANAISPTLAFVFTIIIFFGIYTSAVPLLWTSVRKISKEKSIRYYVATIVLGILGCVVACLVPYAPLMNVLYGVNGYLGFVLVAFMVVHDIRYVVKHRKLANAL